MIFLQLISVVFGIFMMYVARIHRRKKHLESFEAGLWMGTWAVFIFLSVFPQTVRGLAQSFSFARVFDLLVVIALMVIVYYTFMNRITNKSLEQKLEKIIRKNAIDDTSKENSQV